MRGRRQEASVKPVLPGHQPLHSVQLDDELVLAEYERVQLVQSDSGAEILCGVLEQLRTAVDDGESHGGVSGRQPYRRL